METRKSRFDDHMSTIEAGHSKSASVGNAVAGNELLSKLAEELGISGGAAPTAEGEVFPAASDITTAAPAVEAATDAVAMPQVAMAGGVPEIMEAGGQPNPEQLIMPIISAADGNAQTANDLGRTPASVAAAAEPTNKDDSIEDQEAEKVGALIAKSFQATLAKTASDEEYSEAVSILKEAGLLEGYNLQDEGIAKTASAADGYLEKIANVQPLTRQDIVGAAYELVDFQKQAEDAELQGREAAQNLVEMMAKGASDDEDAGEADSEEDEGDEETEKEAQLKVAALLQDPQIVATVKVLKTNGLL